MHEHTPYIICKWLTRNAWYYLLNVHVYHIISWCIIIFHLVLYLYSWACIIFFTPSPKHTQGITIHRTSQLQGILQCSPSYIPPYSYIILNVWYLNSEVSRNTPCGIPTHGAMLLLSWTMTLFFFNIQCSHIALMHMNMININIHCTHHFT